MRPPVRIVSAPVSAALLAAALIATSCARRAAPPLWQAVEIPTDADFVGASFVDSLNGWITGGGWDIDGGIVGRTRDGGRTWRFQTGVIPGGGRMARLGRAQFLDSLRGCVAASAGNVLVTDDGGTTWRPSRASGVSHVALFDLQFVDAAHAWAAGPGAVVRSEDAGETWQRVVRSESENGYLTAFAVHFLDEWRGWLVSNGGRLMRTDDGGRNWVPVPLPLHGDERPTLRDVTFVGGRCGWVVGDEGVIFHTEDAGATWVRQENGVPVVRPLDPGERPRREVLPALDVEPDRLALFAVAFADANRGWTLGYWPDVAQSVVLGTRDGGATWRVEHRQKGELLRALCVLDSTHVWAAGDRARTAPQVVLRYTAGRS
jgi:photosystem II stability/assembly factor-like uncharacterized protein